MAAVPPIPVDLVNNLGRKARDFGHAERAWRILGLDSGSRGVVQAPPLNRSDFHNYMQNLLTAIQPASFNAGDMRKYRIRRRKILSAARTLYGYQGEHWDIRHNKPLPNFALDDSVPPPPAVVGATATHKPGVNPPEVNGAVIPLTDIRKNEYKIRGPDDPTPNEVAWIAQNVKQPVERRFFPYYGFNVRVPGQDPTMHYSLTALPVPEDEDSLWNSIAYFVCPRPAGVEGRMNSNIATDPLQGFRVKAEIWRYFVEVLDSRNPVTMPNPDSPYVEHPRFRMYSILERLSVTDSAEHGRRSILRALHTNRGDAGDAKRMTHEEIFPVIADYYNTEVVVFTPDAWDDPEYQLGLPYAETRAFRVDAYGHPSASPLTTGRQILLVADAERRHFSPVQPPLSHDPAAPYTFPTGHIQGPDRWNFQMPWWPPAAGPLTDNEVAPIHLGAVPAYANPSRPLAAAHPPLSAGDLRRFECDRDVNGPFNGGRVPALASDAEMGTWATEIAPAPALGAPAPARVAGLNQHVCAGLMPVRAGPGAGDFWYRKPAHHSETVRRMKALRDEVERRDLRTSELNDVGDNEYEKEKGYLEFWYDP